MFWVLLVSLGVGALNWWAGLVTLICSIIFLPRKTGTPLA